MDPGVRIDDRFVVERRAASGGMGSVYRAHDLRSGRPVALKILEGVHRGDEVRFAREIAVLASLDHPSVVRFLAQGVLPEGRPYLAMEWLDGEDLATRIARGVRTPWGFAIEAIETAARGLGAAHAEGVIHRDVKPANLLLSRSDDPSSLRVVDFGVALFVEAARQTTTGMLVGTPSYMSPEQVRSDPMDARADVFSLGAVLFELLTGQRLFHGPNLVAILAKIALSEAPFLHDVEDDVPPALDALLARMLASAPSGRPADGAALADELAAVRASLDEGTRARIGVGRRASVRPAGRSTVPPRRPRRPAPSAPIDGSPAEFAANERRALSIVLVPPEAISPGAERSAIDALLARHRPGVQHLVNGALVLVLEGDTTALEQAARAARCALALRDVVGIERIAVASGRGLLDADVPLGEVVDRAASMLLVGRVGIHTDEATAAMLDARFELRDDGEAQLLVLEHEVTEEVRPLLGRVTTFTGRASELAALEGALAHCLDEGVARSVLVVGAAGQGKSRLLRELVARVRARRSAGETVEVWSAGADTMSAGEPLGLVGRIVRSAAGATRGTSAAAQRARIARLVDRRIEPTERARVGAFLAALAGLEDPPDAPVMLRGARETPRAMAEQMRRAWEDLVVAETHAQPLVLIVEDLHWGDAASVELLVGAMRTARERPLLVVASGREEMEARFRELGTGAGASLIALAPLSAKASAAIVREALGVDVPTRVVDEIVGAAAGNPFCLEELVRARARGSTELPESVLAVADARLRALSTEERRVLRAASVFGRAFWTHGVGALLGGDPADVAQRLEALVGAEVLVPMPHSRFTGEPELAFGHVLLRDAAYATLTDADRRTGHALAADWLTAAGERDPLVLAEHHARGGAEGRAAVLFVRAAQGALDGSAPSAALALVERALALDETEAVVGPALFVRGRALAIAGDQREAHAAARDALARLPIGGSEWFQCIAVLAITTRTSIAPELLSLAALTISTDPLPGAADAQLVAAAQLVTLLAGHPDALEQVLAWVEPRVAERGAEVPVAQARLAEHRAHVCLTAGDLEGYARGITRAREWFERGGAAHHAMVQAANGGYALLQLGRLDEASRVLVRYVEEADRQGATVLACGLRVNLGLVRVLAGQLREGVAVLEASGAVARALGDHAMATASRVYLARAHVAAGRLDHAEVEARAAADDPSAGEEFVAYARAVLADVLLARGNVEAARDEIDRAMASLARLGALEEGEALLRVVYADVLRRSRDPRADEAARDAMNELQKRLDRIEDPSTREGFLSAWPEHGRTLAYARASA